MNSKILQVFYDDKCYPFKDQERQVRFPIIGNSFVGASNITKIRFYIKEIGSVDDTWVANSKLPNGRVGNQILNTKGTETINGVEEPYVELSLSTFYTQAKGDVYISLNSFYGGVSITQNNGVYTITGVPTIQATGSIKFSVYYATPLMDGDELESITLSQVLAEVSTKLGKSEGKYLKVVSNITAINGTTYADYLRSGDIVYSVYNKQFYLLGGSHPSLTYSVITLELNNALISELSVNDFYATHIYIYDFEYFEDRNEKTLPVYIQELADLLDQFVFTMTGSSMDLTDAQYNRLVGNDNIRIAYTYNGHNLFFEKIRKNYNNQDLYKSTYRFKEDVGSGAGQYTRERYAYIVLDRTNKRLGAGLDQFDIYNKSQADALLDLKADKSDTYTKAQVDSKLAATLHYEGSKTVAQLNALSLGENDTGKFYNVNDSGVLSIGSLEVLAGDNVVWTGSSWDKLTMDLSVYDDKFIAAGFFEVQNYNETSGEITFVYSSDLYGMSYDSNTGIMTIEAN